MKVDKIGVHRTHCCVRHGCKYGEDEFCPVMAGDVIQEYICEECDYEKIESVEELLKLEKEGKQKCPTCGNIY